MKITIDNEEVLCNKDFTINEEMLNTSSVILNNVYPATWEQDKDYVSRFYYPKDYSKCKIFNEIEHPEEKSTAEGTSFSIEVDTTKQYQVQTLKGQTSQTGTPTPTSPQPINITTGRQVVSVCGKNILDLSGFITHNNYGGLNISYSNGKLLIDGTATGNVDMYLLSTGWNTKAQELSNIINSQISYLTLSSTKSGLIYYFQMNGAYIQNTINRANPTDNITNMFVRIPRGTSLNNEEIGIQLERNSQPSTYEEYKGNDYEINLGKNLFNKDNITSITNGTLSNDIITSNAISSNYGGVSANISGLTLEAGTYILSMKVQKESGTVANNLNTFLITSTPSITKTLVSNPNLTSDYQTYSVKLVCSGTTQLTNVGVQLKSGNTNAILKIKEIQLEVGSNETSFTPYKPPIYLGKIGTYQDYIFRNTTENPLYDSNLEEGQWYIHKEIGRYDFTGTENFSASQWGTNSWDLSNIIATTFNTNELQIMSNLFKGVPHANRGTGGNNIIYTISNNGFEIRNTTYSTLTDIRNATKGSYIYWVLATPTNTLIEDEELINQLNSIQLLEGLNNVPVSSANLPFIMSLMYNYVPEYTEEDLLFCGVVENTGNVSLNPRYPHYCNLQVLDFKTFLSEGETLDFVIYEKTILEAINQVIGTISDYGFVLGNVNILHEDEVIGAYSTKDKTAYDVFNYIADITQSRWTTRMVDENIVAIDFYDPSLMLHGTAIDYTQEWFCNNKIIDMSFSYSSRDYRNKQVMLSGEVYANIETTEVIIADGYQTQFNTIDKIGYVSSILLNGNPATIITKEEYNLGYEGDFIYQPGNQYFESVDLISTGAVITIVYFAIIEGREIVLNQEEISRVSNMIDRKGIIARYENRNDATTTSELQAIGQSYLKYKGSPEVSLKIDTLNNIWDIGEKVSFSAPLTELTTEYMVKKKTINYITTQDNIFYSYELSSNFNSETEINYFDNQRSKMMGNIGQGEYISRNIDIENTANVIFYDLEVEEVQLGDNTLQSELQSTLGVE